MRLMHGKSFIGMATAIALCASPTVATAATATPIQPFSPLVAVSLFGTQASAQQVCTNAAGAAAAAGSAAAAQGQAGCVLPATDGVAPPAYVGPPAMVVERSGIGITPIILGLIGIAALAALIASGNDDNDSPISPS
jgi:hypothetical protein